MKRLNKREYFGFVFAAPWLIGFLLFFIYPFVDSLILSFQKVLFDQGQAGGFSSQFLGWGNYITAVTKDEKYIPLVLESVVNMLINVPVCLVLSFFIAVLLNQKFRGNYIVKAFFFLPVILGTGVFLQAQMSVSSVQGLALNSAMNEGVDSMKAIQGFNIAKLLQDIGVPGDFVGYISAPVARIYSVITMSGVQIFIFLAGLNSINPSVYEAAYIEGASGWESFWKITFPMVSPVIIVNVVYSIIDSFTAAGNSIMQYLYDMAFTGFDYGLSSAMSWIYCLILAIVVGLSVFLISRKTVY